MEDLDDWPVTGEVPSTDPSWLVGPAHEHFVSSANNLVGSGLKKDHEIGTVIDNEHVSVISGHKHRKEIAVGAVVAGLTVAGVLLATRQLRIRHKHKK